MTDGLSLFDLTVELPGEAELAEATLAVPAGAGVCLFTNQDDQPILLIHGANLRAIVRNRLAEPDPDEKTRRTRLRPVTTRLRIRRAYSAFETQLAYFHAAAALYPDRYREFFPRLSLHLISIDPTATYPYFQVTDRRGDDRCRCWGPFSTAKAAAEYLQVLQDVFDLCRRNDLLAQAPHGEACPYGQMNRCLVVCDGTVAAADYRNRIAEAMDFLDRPQQARDRWQEQMKSLAGELKFEQAQRLKLRTSQVDKLLGRAYSWVRPLADFAVLAFQPGPRMRVEGKRRAEETISPFVIGPGWISQIEPFGLSDPLAGCQGLIDHLALTRFQAGNTDPGEQNRRIFAWVARFLYGTVRDKGLYLPVEALPEAQQLAQQVAEHFAQVAKPKKKKPDLDTAALSEQVSEEAKDDPGQ